MRTIRREVALAGKGIHTGEPCELVLRPAPGAGIVFRRSDRPGTPAIPLTPDTFRLGGRCSMVEAEGTSVSTVEHLLSVFFVLGVTDVEAALEGPELPAAGGSAAAYLALVEDAGLVETGRSNPPLVPAVPFTIEEGGASVSVLPLPGRLEVEYLLDLSPFGLGAERVEYEITPSAFAEKIAPARTFVPAPLVEKLRAAGFGKGADPSNTFVPGDPSFPERFPAEAAAHKVLDLLGDLCPLGRPLHARIEAKGSGHSLNHRLLRKLLEER